MANRRQAKKNAAAAVNKEAAKKEVKTTVAEEADHTGRNQEKSKRKLDKSSEK